MHMMDRAESPHASRASNKGHHRCSIFWIRKTMVERAGRRRTSTTWSLEWGGGKGGWVSPPLLPLRAVMSQGHLPCPQEGHELITRVHLTPCVWSLILYFILCCTLLPHLVKPRTTLAYFLSFSPSQALWILCVWTPRRGPCFPFSDQFFSSDQSLSGPLLLRSPRGMLVSFWSDLTLYHQVA